MCGGQAQPVSRSDRPGPGGDPGAASADVQPQPARADRPPDTASAKAHLHARHDPQIDAHQSTPSPRWQSDQPRSPLASVVRSQPAWRQSAQTGGVPSTSSPQQGHRNADTGAGFSSEASRKAHG